MTKILVSTGYGAGWSTWVPDDKRKEIAEYRPIIDFIESGGNPEDLDQRSGPHHDLIIQMMVDLGLKHFHTGGADGLEVVEVDGPYLISEYDGWESVITARDFW